MEPESYPNSRSASESPNRRAGEVSTHIHVHAWFEHQAARRPEAIAAVCGSERITYADLNTLANRYGRHLRAKGIRTGDFVPIYLERSIQTVAVILGTLKAGAAYLPIDPAYPADRIQFMLEDSQAKAIVTESKFRDLLGDFKGQVILIDDHMEDDASSENLAVSIPFDSAAYVIYTSGSTGKPKGVVVTHQNVVRLFQSTEAWFHFDASDVWTVFHSFAFDFSVWELWGALFYGGRLVIIPYFVSRSPAVFFELLASEGVTVLNQTPSAFRQLIWAEANHATTLPLQLRYVVFGGEALELQSLRPWFDRHGDSKPVLINMYGITETTVHVTYRRICQVDLDANLGSVIGVPIPDLTLHLLDEQLNPVPEGTPGEICVGGAGVARGYWNRPDLTAQKFVPDVFGTNPTAKLYRSGDLARRTPNGELEYLGRMDHQVKIRGFRIELGEIETILHSHPAIRESSVIAREDHAGSKILVAYVVASRPHLDITELKNFLGQKLPAYMVPAHVVVMAALPLTVNGKVDRAALPAPDTARPELTKPYVAPSTDREKSLAAIWARTLGIDDIGVDDNYFELGGDSIKSIQLLAQAGKQGLHFSLQDLFETPTVRALASRTGGQASENAVVEPFAMITEGDRKLLRGDLEDAYPMAKLQVGMVFHSDYDPASAIFHDVFSFRLKLPFHEMALREAIDRLVIRHPIFRTSFHLGEFSEPLQLVHRTVRVPLTFEDLRLLTSEGQREKLKQWVESEKRNRFVWTEAPMMRLHLQRYNDEAFQFIVSFHHIIMDGWSLAAMLTELFQDYAAILAKRNETIAAPQIQYRDFVALERETIRSEATRSFWRHTLEGMVVHRLPRWSKEECAGGREQVRGPEIIVKTEIFEKLKNLAQQAGVPIRTVLLAAHCRVMSLLTGQSDITTGLVANGRPQAVDGEKLIGLFLNTIPLRVDANKGSWNDLVKATFESERALLPHRRMPLSEIQALVGGPAMFETTFDFVQFHVYRDLPGYKEQSFLEDYYFEANNFNFFVTFMLDASGRELQFHFDYNPNDFGSRQISAICEYYEQTLAAMAHEPKGQVTAAMLLGREEQERLLHGWNQTGTENTALNFPQIFEAQAGKTPARVAVIDAFEKISYAELNQRASIVAAYLMNLNVERPLVGIFMRRSVNMLAAILGVLKAGGAYLPLDPAFPAERLKFMVEDSAAPILIADESLLKSAPETDVMISVESLVSSNGASMERGHDIQPADRAYVIYTSGSTGKPKGVEIPHRALSNFIQSMRVRPGISSSDVVMATTTLSFDISVLELLLPLTVGASIVVADSNAVLDPAILIGLMEEHSVTFMQATPTGWRAVLDAGWQGNDELTALSGGEPLPPSLARELLEKAGALWNMYGPTETTVWSSIFRVTEADGEIPVGRPIANTAIFVLDPALQPVPVGSEGEIYIGGEGLALGYLNRPELTLERFVPNPFKAGERLYRTGDLGHFLPDGNLICSGRADFQVKIRGFRIELGEIEQVLQNHPSIASAVVVSRANGVGDPILAAFCVGRGPAPIATEAVREFLLQKLPHYMTPSRLVELQELPTTPNGKIDRSKLPKLDELLESRDVIKTPPRTPLESEMVELWKEVLRVPELGIHDNFFELGGHSLLAMQVVSRLRNRFDIEFKISTLFENPTVERYVSEIVEELMAHADDSEAVSEPEMAVAS